MNSELNRIEARIEQVKADLMQLGEMRPGSLSSQPRARGKLYWQLSYTHAGKGHTEYVQAQLKDRVEEQLATYRRFRKLTSEWVELALQHAKLQMTLLKESSQQ